MLQLAEDDASALHVMAPSGRISAGIFGFHAQQAAEKGLKAWLSLLGIEYPRTHRLSELINLLDGHGAEGVDDYRHLQKLDPFAVQFRYEQFTDLGGELPRDEIIREISEFLAHVAELIAGSGPAG